MTRPAVYVEGAALEISFADGRRNLQELIFDTVRAAVDDSGQPMREIDSVVLAAHDLVDGRSLSSMVTSPQPAPTCGTRSATATTERCPRDRRDPARAATPAARSSRPGAGPASTARTSSPGRCLSRSGPARWAWMSSCCRRCGPSCAWPPGTAWPRRGNGLRCGELATPAPIPARCATAASGRPRISPSTTRISRSGGRDRRRGPVCQPGPSGWPGSASPPSLTTSVTADLADHQPEDGRGAGHR